MTKREVLVRIEGALNEAEAQAADEDEFMIYAGASDGLALALELVQQMED